MDTREGGAAPGHSAAVPGPRRWPRRVYSTGTEPDPRFTFANERTYLAWIRTSLALVAAGVSMEAFVEDFPDGLREGIALGLILTGMAAALTSFARWMNSESALRTGRPLPSPGIAPILALVMGLVALVLAVFVVIRA
jgi:putative membrane protein